MRIEKKDKYVAVHGDFNVLSSAVYNGGYTTAKTIINLEVPKDFNGEPEDVFESFITDEKFEPVVGMMTAASVKDAKVSQRENVVGIVTAGLSGTINIILLINKDLAKSAMANAIIVATEAKTAALFDLDIRNGASIRTGTPTDSIVIACYGKEEARYAGPMTDIGNQIYEIVRTCVKDVMEAQEGIVPDRSILERLKEGGIVLEDIISSAMELYVPDTDKSLDEVEKRLRDVIKKQCADVNVSSLIASALHLEDELRCGRLRIEGDPAYVISDELMGLSIAEYIGGSRGKFNFTRYDMKKPGILKELGIFLDDAISGLIAGCMTRLFEDWEC
jgi:alpha-ribazole phosphatase CobZ